MTASFPKSARLLSRSDFVFASYEAFEMGAFKVLVNRSGKGRIGITVPKRAIKLSPGRNRVKRLVREAFRVRRRLFCEYDLHVIARNQLGFMWRQLKIEQIH